MCDILSTATLGFDLLDGQTGGIITKELSDLKSLLHALSTTLDGVASKKAAAWLDQLTQKALSQGHNPPKITGDEPLSQAERKIYEHALPTCTCHHAPDQMLENL